ncbi:MAG: hypothetical protein FD138_1298 [Planctomycetota bacterium]|nr:MAG: hypothetical protein FD138_1298 [Planctomycetota bacterium]
MKSTVPARCGRWWSVSPPLPRITVFSNSTNGTVGPLRSAGDERFSDFIRQVGHRGGIASLDSERTAPHSEHVCRTVAVMRFPKPQFFTNADLLRSVSVRSRRIQSCERDLTPPDVPTVRDTDVAVVCWLPHRSMMWPLWSAVCQHRLGLFELCYHGTKSGSFAFASLPWSRSDILTMAVCF